MEFEDILKSVGDYGRYQRRLLFLFLIPTTIIFSIYCMNTFFMLSEPDHWCYVQELSNLPSNFQQKLSRPTISSTDSDKFDSCHYYDIDYENELKRFNLYLLSKNKNNSTQEYILSNNVTSLPRKKCTKWIYDKTNYDYNAVTELNLVCDQKHLKSLIQSLHGLGEVVGNPFFGLLSDKFGRHKVFFAAVGAALLSSFSPVISGGLIAFALCRFLNSFTTASLYNLPYIIMTELVGPKQRTRLVGIGAICWTIGMCILPFIAYLTRNYVSLTVVPTLFVLPIALYWKFLPESPRWLLSQGKYEEAYQVMAKIAKTNGKPVPPDLMASLIAFNQKKRRDSLVTSRRNSVISDKVDSVPDAEQGFLVLFKYPGLRRNFLILTLAWVANVCSYRGLTLNFENFHGNEFVNWLLLSLVEFPSNLFSWFLMETCLGRRWSQSISMTLGGIALCLPVIIPGNMPNAVIVVSLAGKFLCNMAYNVVYQQTAELMPTPGEFNLFVNYFFLLFFKLSLSDHLTFT